MIQKEAVPPLPTREQELAYLKWLEKSFGTDKNITLHPKFYGASPFRLQFKNHQEYKSEYYKTFLMNFIWANVIFAPAIF